MTFKLDKSSKVLIIISLVGIVLSSSALFYTFNFEDDSEVASAPIAELSFAKADTRIKRSGNIHWYSVEDTLPCFRNDLVFTGTDSTATLTFGEGDKVYLLPNSLVSISDKFISLESGSIEVDLNGKEALAVESFGQIVTLKEKARFRIVKSNKEKKIIPISGKSPAPAVFKIEPKKIEPVAKRVEEFLALYPRQGMTIPAFPDHQIILDWTYSGADQNFEIEIDGQRFKSSESQLKVAVNILTPGKKKWTVTTPKSERLESDFELTSDFQISLLTPEQNAQMKLSNENAYSVDFSWTRPIPYTQKIQIASDEAFSENLQVTEVATGTLKQELVPGKYFWKVSYYDQDKVVYSSESQYFTIIREAVITPKISIRDLPQVLDFSLTPVITLRLSLSHPMKNVSYTITGPAGSKAAAISKLSFVLPQLQDGKYQLKITAELRNGQKAMSPNYLVRVKNSKPLEAPKINGKKVKLFVKILEGIWNQIFPSAHAAPQAFFPLKWAPNSDVGRYELEITNNDRKTVIINTKLKTNTYKFFIPRPGTYYWRVRQNEKGKWGPFSEFTEIAVEDKISLIEKPLMKKSTVKKDKFTFEWDEPYKDFTYTLNIFIGNNPKPIKSLEVKGGKHTEEIKKSENVVYWQVRAKSVHGNESKDESKIAVPDSAITPEPVIATVVKKDIRFVLRGSYLQTAATLDQEADDTAVLPSSSTSLAGPSLQVKAEAWRRRLGIIITARTQTLTGDDIDYQDSEYIGEVGWIWRNTKEASHMWAAGFSAGLTKLDFGTQQIDSTRASLTFRYQYEKYLSQSWSFETNPMFLQPLQAALVPPSLRLPVAVNYYYRPTLWLSLSASYEMNNSILKYDESGFKGDLEVANKGTLFGLTLNWANF